VTNSNLVSIVVLNWNGARYLSDCLKSIYLQDYKFLEIIIVDNGSTDGSVEFLKENYPDLRLILNGENLGFAQGMNIGIQASKGEYVLLLNEDIYLDFCFVTNGIKEFNNNKRVGWVGGVVYALVNGTRSGKKISGAYVLKRRFQLKYLDKLEKKKEVLMVNNCAMFLRRAALDDVCEASGWLDRDYFAYWEDTDLALRFCLREWICLFLPEMRLWHVLSGSMDGKSRLVDKPLKFQLISLSNRYRTIIKDLPFLMLVELLPFLIITEFLIVPYFMFLSPRTLLCNFRAIINILKSLPALLSQRKLIQETRTIPYLKFRRFFVGL